MKEDAMETTTVQPNVEEKDLDTRIAESEQNQIKISEIADQVIALGATDIIVINKVLTKDKEGKQAYEQRVLFNTLNLDKEAPLFAKVDYFANLSLNLAQHFTEQRVYLFRQEKIFTVPGDSIAKLVNENKALRKRCNLPLDENLIINENGEIVEDAPENGPVMEKPATEQVQ